MKKNKIIKKYFIIKLFEIFYMSNKYNINKSPAIK